MGKRPRSTPAEGQAVLGFYGHRASAPFREFSNFYQADAFSFELPDFAQRPGFDKTVRCEFSEKAIMLMKASIMEDLDTFNKIKVCKDPAAAKALGRSVKPFRADLWDRWVEEVAFQAVLQKFAASEQLKEKLLSTGDVIIAEATRNDRIWGIGLDVGDPRVQDREKWQGRNILGEALMRARAVLRGDGEEPTLVAEAAGEGTATKS
eukprot:TRINITY_DN86277_c0_g1_i1.p1 TRINITY_DN86277_c0_g1~~TRINITY_DN86277_c0_g1_i1.p1  ORF type:complete len:222 (+),score=54.80 TRINITY_DN86277_c0_g1_i1:47-667(+)